jgi:hypothetical protein
VREAAQGVVAFRDDGDDAALAGFDFLEVRNHLVAHFVGRGRAQHTPAGIR